MRYFMAYYSLLSTVYTDFQMMRFWPLHDNLVMPTDIFVVTTGEEGYHWWVEGMDASKTLQCPGQLPHTTINYPAQNVNNAKAEKP